MKDVSNNRPCILLTNDDGVTSPGILSLANKMTACDWNVVVVAPNTNQSACSHRLTMAGDLVLKRLPDLGENVYSLSGSPADCVSVALDSGGLLSSMGLVPTMAISGINLGPNTSHDVLHSGTFAGARHAGFYGIPSLATSLASSDMREENVAGAVEATVQLCSILLKFLPSSPINYRRPSSLFSRRRIESSYSETQCLECLLQCFQQGDLLLNLNVPSKWNGKYMPTSLGGVFYRDVLKRVSSANSDDEVFRLVVHGGIDFVPDDRLTDIEAIRRKSASITSLQTWPETHPFEIPSQVMKYALHSSEDGLPAWIGKAVESHALSQL
eukprot:jgi/Galph1/5394/GphlegSOOS_G4020.1